MKGELNFDKIGIICSSACILHCLITPLALSLLPSVFLDNKSEWIHIGLMIIILPNALYIFVKSRMEHKSNTPLIVGFMGLAFLITALLLEGPLKKLSSEVFSEQNLTILGGVILCFAHLQNFKLKLNFHRVPFNRNSSN